MIRSTRFFPLCAAALLAALPNAASAQYVEVFSEADVAGGITGSFLEAVTVSGGVAYAVSRDTSAADVGAVVSYDGSTFSTVSTVAQWQATGSSNDLALGNGFGVVGNVLRGVSFFDNNAIEIDLGTGTVTEVVSAATIDAASGVTSNLSAVYETAADGTIYSIESVSDQLLAISPGNAVSVEINTADLAAALGGTSIGGIGLQGDNVLLGSNSNDSLIAWDTVANSASTVLDTATIDGLTDDVDGVVSFGDIFAAPDGLVYFYEGDADFLMSFDPANPASSLSVVLTEAQFNSGPGSDTINQLSWWNGNIAWTDGSLGFYAIPEPTTVMLAALALVGVCARRR